MLYDRLGVWRLVLLAPLFVTLVVIDDDARWAATALYLAYLALGAVARRFGRGPWARSALGAAAVPLLTLTAIAGLAAGGAVLAGPVGAGVAIVARDLVNLAGRVGGASAEARPGRFDAGLRFAVALALVLLIVPLTPSPPLYVDPHALGGCLFMACGGAALIPLAAELWRSTKTRA